MIEGSPAEWDDLFANKLIPSVLNLVLGAWERIEKPSEDELEPATCLRLYAAILRSKDRQKHPFLPRYEDVEIDFEPARVTGRKDIVFYPSVLDHDVYFCLEAKRLNARVNGRMKSLAEEYVKNGMFRFITGQYSRRVRYGGMLGFVLDGDIKRAMKNVQNNIESNRDSLGMPPTATWMPSTLRTADPHAKETEHRRSLETAVFHIHHLFVA